LRLSYRVRQLWLALVGTGGPVDEAVLRRHLNAEQMALFLRMSGAEQAHALAVLRTVQTPKRGYGVPKGGGQGVGDARALAQAALLHDVGKVGGRIQLWHRVATVLLNAWRPALLHRLALNELHSWRYPFFVLLHHAERGAELVAGVGTDAVAVALIRAHHTAVGQSGLNAQERALLSVLQSADEQN